MQVLAHHTRVGPPYTEVERPLSLRVAGVDAVIDLSSDTIRRLV